MAPPNYTDTRVFIPNNDIPLGPNTTGIGWTHAEVSVYTSSWGAETYITVFDDSPEYTSYADWCAGN